MTRSVFRPEIQALRAIAVAFVLAFHLWPGAVRGGYIGVDVFFVISGFLITGHLRAEVGRTGSVALLGFWGRRIRRLLPAASVVLGASFVAMLAIVPQSLWQRTVTEIAASALSVQNWVLAANSVDYLGADGAPTLVQHYWSLSVEEQFYLAWPVLIVLTVLVARRRPLRAVALVLGVVFAGSLALAVAQTGDPAAYFSTPGRAWEFAAGGLLACVPAGVVGRMRPAVRGVLALAGAGLIVLPALFYTEQTPFPGAWTLLPVVGTMAVIAARPASRPILARPVQFLGAVSYPLYLWHWPLVVLSPYLLGAPLDGAWTWAVLAASLLLAWLTVRFVEGPLHGRARLVPHHRRAYAAAAGVAVVLLVAGVSTTGLLQASGASAARAALQGFETDPCYGAAAMDPANDCADPFAVPASLDTAFAAADKGSLAQPCSAPAAELVTCEFGETRHPTRTVAVVGNSHAGHLIAGFDAYGKEHGWRVVLMRKTGCTGTSTSPLTETGCREWARNVLERVGRDDIDVVVFATNNDSLHYLADDDADQTELRAGIAANFAALVSTGHTVVAVGDVPGSSEPVPDCVYLHRGEDDPCSTERMGEHGNIVAEVARGVAGVRSLDLEPYFCSADRCHALIGGAVVYIDEHHLTASFSRSLAPYLGASIAP
ncbi:peptidoglycan/LPS O-acetylase OafA/YrhL [Conyzicola lurida]|uniref:Peptidoglycan/LPS O-acetylase OafA/YrhL n=1 Tax=Conyzicola lurida TaxID=1172621 RepID=A0A841AJE3_9MICO|nr:peptidoglycan/LPS O-acetylase OafA/YrhL [Conyzicola lurida]